MRITTIAQQRYTPGAIEYSQFIRGGVGADYHQNPQFYQHPDGELIVTWGAYDFDECSPNCVLLYSTSRDRGITWSDPQVFIADFSGGSIDHLLRLRLRDGQTLMFVQQARHIIEVDEKTRVATVGANYFRSRTQATLRRSGDGGRTFDRGENFVGGLPLPGGEWYGSVDCALQLRSGRVLAAFMFMDPRRVDFSRTAQGYAAMHFTVMCHLSDDGGRTWRPGGEIVADTLRGTMEVQIVETEPNKLFALFRTSGGFLYQSRSEDGGETWSVSTPSTLGAPEAMARMIRLQSGNLLVVWNNVSSTEQSPRYPLAATLSRDGGRTWGEPKIIATETGANQLSNHGVIQLDDGRVLLGISHYRAVTPMTSDFDLAIFDEKWLTT